MKFVFLLTIWNTVNGADVYVEDSDLSGTDCIEKVVAYEIVNPEHTHGDPSCEIDYGR